MPLLLHFCLQHVTKSVRKRTQSVDPAAAAAVAVVIYHAQGGRGAQPILAIELHTVQHIDDSIDAWDIIISHVLHYIAAKRSSVSQRVMVTVD